MEPQPLPTRPVVDIAAPPRPAPAVAAPQPTTPPSDLSAPVAEAVSAPKPIASHATRSSSSLPVGVITVTILVMLFLSGLAVALYLTTNPA